MSKLARKLAVLLLALLTAAVLLGGCGSKADTKEETAKTEETETEKEDKKEENADAQRGDEITVTVKVVHKDESVKEFTYTTDFVMLGDLLRDEELVEGVDGSAGYYVTAVDGEEADDKNQEWWMVSQNGEMTQTGVDTTEMKDGDVFELTYTTGYY